MELKDLCGERLLSGVDFTTVRLSRYGYEEECNVCRFRLDGVTYEAVEDPSDGYRSSMRDLVVSSEPTTNEWPPVRVLCSYEDRDAKWGGENDLLIIRDMVTGKEVLRVGTRNVDDYYPSFTSDFTPENLSHNEGR